MEKSVYAKLNSSGDLVHLKLDALLLFQVYADLVVLAKSKQLKKVVLDMNTHYLELLTFLKELQKNPMIIMNCDYQVFKSESSLYGDNKDINHRTQPKSKLVLQRVFLEDEWDSTLLYPLVVSGAQAMEAKLVSYAHTQLPGGIYWDPDPVTRQVLNTLEPSNDICESILGLNDYLSTAIPNMSQETRTNLVEVKKNKTVSWLDSLSQVEQNSIVTLAQESRKDLEKQRQDVNQKRSEQRKELMVKNHAKAKALVEKTQKLS